MTEARNIFKVSVQSQGQIWIPMTVTGWLPGCTLEHGLGRPFLSEPDPRPTAIQFFFFKPRTEPDRINFSTVHTNATFTYVFL